MIPDGITKEHVLKAVEYIRQNGVPEHRESVRFFLVYNGENFPPKYVISLANKYANGTELDPSAFSGGTEANNFLEKLGFRIVEESTATKANIWIEKTYWKSREHKQKGEFALGKNLVSPQKDKRNADIYRNMRLAKKGDIVLHLVDNEAIVGVSKVQKEYNETPNFLYPREWDNETGKDPGYLVALEGFILFEKRVERNELFRPEHEKELKAILDSEGNVFYNRDLNLRQGAYLTAVPERLVELINKVYKEKNGKEIPYWKEQKIALIALIGPTDEKYIAQVRQAIAENGRACSTWTYSLSKEKIALLNKQKPFHLYCYITKSSGGSGLVEYRLRVADFIFSDKKISCPYSDEKPVDSGEGRGWYIFDKLEKLEPPQNVASFELYDDVKSLSQRLFSRLRQPESEFIYIKDSSRQENFPESFDDTFFENIKNLLECKNQIILYGPPGTGKTFQAQRIAVAFLKQRSM